MKLVEAMLYEQRARRPHWPVGVFVQPSTQHQIGAHPIVLCNTDATDLEPATWVGHLTLRGADPFGRTIPRKNYGSGAFRPEFQVVRFQIDNWQPPIDDLMAEDWILL